MKKKAWAEANEILKRERLMRGWTQVDLAKSIGSTPITVCRWEQGFTSPTPYYRQRLADLFGKSPIELGLLSTELHESNTPHSSQSLQIELPELWNVPYQRNPFFTGRADVLTRLHKTLKKSTPLPAAITGLGGVGKTQIAVEYAYRYSHFYKVVLWIHADSQETLTAGFVNIASVLDLPIKNVSDQSVIFASVMNWLATHSNWLLIFDNVEDVEMIRPILLYGVYRRGHILLTTRSHTLGQMALVAEVDVMETQEAALFLLRRTNAISLSESIDQASEEDRNTAQRISEILGRLPLALDQAGAYILETSSSLSHYLDLYQQRYYQFLKRRGSFIIGHPESVTATFSLSIQKVEHTNPFAAELLRFCAFLYPDVIPEEIIIEGASEFESKPQPAIFDPIEMDIAIGQLLQYSFIHRDNVNRTITIHRLIQSVLKETMDEEIQRQWAERIVRAVSRVFPDVEFAAWPECQRCLPQAQMCTLLIKQFNIASEEAMRLLNKTGKYLQEHAQYAQAESLYQQALQIGKQEQESIELASILDNLGSLYYDEGKYDQAEPFFKEALNLCQERLGSQCPQIGRILNNLAALYIQKSVFAQAEKLLKQALEILQQEAESYDVAESLNNLALLHYMRKEYDQAESLAVQALSICEKTLDPSHPTLATSLSNLAMIYTGQGKYNEAEMLYQRALQIREEALGREHPLVAMTLERYAELLERTNQESQAKVLKTRVNVIRDKQRHENFLVE